VSNADAGALKACFTKGPSWDAVDKIALRLGGAQVSAEPVLAWGTFRVPYLAIRVGKQLEICEESHFLDGTWNLAQCSPDMPEDLLPREGGMVEEGTVDVNAGGKVEIAFIRHLHDQLALLEVEPGWTLASLANWLDRQVLHQDVPRSQSSLFIHKVLSGLMEQRKLSLEQIARIKYRLRQAVGLLIERYRASEKKKSYQSLLFKDGAKSIEVGPELCFQYDETRYPANRYYSGPLQFQKHYYFGKVGEMNDEEAECAHFIDTLPEVRCWVRNLDQRSEYSWSLPTATDRFYPDFVAMLQDGRILVVEYKGEHLWTADDAKEKRAVGELWADCSKGRCLFVMPKGPNFETIRRMAVYGRIDG
jgi:type III restriction enzyme